MIIRLMKLHINLIKYILKEFKKLKDNKARWKFFKATIKNYFKVLKNEFKQFKLMFNKEYRLQRKEFEKKQRIHKDLQTAIKLLDYLNKKIYTLGYNRNARRQFWRDFSKKGEVRKELFDELMKDIDIWRSSQVG